MPCMRNSCQPEYFRVVHPLEDAPEQKCVSEGLGQIAMTPSVRLSLKVLRGYLFLMTAMLLYHVLDLAGALKHFNL
jgi:hypothetical protein